MSNTSELNIPGLRVVNLRCALLSEPIGVGEERPRLSWEYEGASPVVAWRVLAGSWDTGRVESSATAVRYGGGALRSRQAVAWSVAAWAVDGAYGAANATFEIGLLSPHDWVAQWIGAPQLSSPPYFHRTFSLGANPVRARLYATALGIYAATLNGERVGRDVFTPGWTDYHHRVQYQVYDVAALLRRGENVLSVELADGWYAGYVGFLGRNIYGTEPELLVQLEVDLDDGSTAVITSDAEWLAAAGPRRSADLLMGEVFDARHAALEWTPVRRSPGPTASLVATAAPPTRATTHLAPRQLSEPQPGVYVFDVGQNVSGWVQLRATGPAGTHVTLRFAEVLNPDGSLYTENLRTARATDEWFLAGDPGGETFEPTFTFHGFRYVEVTGYPGPPVLAALTAVVCTADLPATGTFECDDATTNQLQSNIVWSQRGNFVEVPTDCPQRDERLGWTGDAQVFAPTACFNADVDAFLRRWLIDMVAAQADDGAFPVVVPRLSGPNPDENDGAPGWGDAGVIVPWELYVRYGDRSILERCFDAMVRWVDHIHDANRDYLWRHRRHGDMGDWLSIEAESPKEVLGTSFFFRSADLVARAAAALGRDDARDHRARADAVREAFRSAYVEGNGTIEGDTQTIYALALRFGLLDDATAQLAAKRLVADVEGRDYHLSTGFLGVAHLLPALTDAGYVDVAYRLVHQDTYPAWGYAIARGATTIWERWDGWTDDRGFQDPAMNSFNHYSFGAVGEWLYESVAGIRLVEDAPGYERVVIAPQPGGRVRRVRATYRSVRGPIGVAWSRDEDCFTLNVSLSPGCVSAEVRLPDGATHTVGAGRHEFNSGRTSS